ncbi:MAG: hypothetical protein WBO10_04290 [Pyrinomonadaceae bacterium]
MVLRILSALLFVIWLALVLAGKGGFVHFLLLISIGIAGTEIVALYRPKMREQ